MQRSRLNLWMAMLVVGASGWWSSGCGLGFGPDLPSSNSDGGARDPDGGVLPDLPSAGGTLLDSSGTGGHLTGTGGDTARTSELGGGGAGGDSKE